MFEGQVIIITGGSSGIGKAVAERLIRRGAHLALIARDRARLDKAKDELKAVARPEQKIEVFSCRVEDAAAAERTIKDIAAGLGAPDILINSAGILRESYFEKQPLEIFHEIMDINFFGTLHCIKAVLPYFKEQGRGRIVNVSSVAGRMGVFGYTAYCSSKHAVVGLTHSLRFELKPQNIKFHIVYPPETETPMLESVKHRTPENKKMARTIRVLAVGEVADAIIKGLECEQYEIIPGFSTRGALWAMRVLPGLSRWVVDSRIKKYYQGPK